MYLIIFLSLVISMLACHLLAKRKGRKPVAWGVTGAILGPIGILLLLFIPDRTAP